MAEAVELTNAGESTVYMLTPMTDYTFVKNLAAADGFVFVEEETDPDLETHIIHVGEDPEDEEPDEEAEETAEDPEEEDEPEDETAEKEDELEDEEEPEPEPEPQPEKNYGKRKAWHEKIVNWYMQGRQPEWIAQELGLNKNTVIYHLHKEGLK